MHDSFDLEASDEVGANSAICKVPLDKPGPRRHSGLVPRAQIIYNHNSLPGREQPLRTDTSNEPRPSCYKHIHFVLLVPDDASPELDSPISCDHNGDGATKDLQI